VKVSEIGEFGLIDRLTKIVECSRSMHGDAWKQLILGIGDDAAVWRCDAPFHIVTVDASIEGVHFTLDVTSWKDLGWKSLARSLSDIAAMGGLPRYALISLALPGSTEVDDVVALYEGMVEVAQQFGVAIIGGNISLSPVVMIDTVVIGVGEGSQVLSRSSARVGDRIAVTNTLGGAAAGFHMLSCGLKLEPASAASLHEAFLRPVPRIGEGRLLIAEGVKAAIDISDGLLSDLGHICVKSGVGAMINVDLVPVHHAAMDCFSDMSLDMALSGGEDYELLFTAGPEILERMKEAATFPITEIGEIVASGKSEVMLVNGRGMPYRSRGTGWEHFSKSLHPKSRRARP